MDIPKDLQNFKLTAQKDAADAEDFLYKEVWRFAEWMPFGLRQLLDYLIPNSVKFTGKADLSSLPYWPPVLFQDTLGACVENALSTVLTYDQAKQGDTLSPGPSRLFMYWVARGGTDQDTGTSLSAAFNAVHNTGACLETVWPYDIAQFAVKPPPAAFADAAHRKSSNYYRLIDQNDMMACLDAGYPFVIRFTLFDGFYHLDAKTYILDIPGPSEKPVGGHAVTVYGYDLARKVFLVQNSWGDWWANKGRFEMTFGMMADPIFVQDAWCVRAIADS